MFPDVYAAREGFFPAPPGAPAPFYPGMDRALEPQWCDTCAPSWNLLDGVCDDGGDGASWAECDFNTDCTDCGDRLQTVPHLGHLRLVVPPNDKTILVTPRMAADALLDALSWCRPLLSCPVRTIC